MYSAWRAVRKVLIDAHYRPVRSLAYRASLLVKLRVPDLEKLQRGPRVPAADVVERANPRVVECLCGFGGSRKLCAVAHPPSRVGGCYLDVLEPG